MITEPKKRQLKESIRKKVRESNHLPFFCLSFFKSYVVYFGSNIYFSNLDKNQK